MQIYNILLLIRWWEYADVSGPRKVPWGTPCHFFLFLLKWIDKSRHLVFF